MEERNNSIKDFLQSPKGLTIIVICVAVLLAVYLLLSTQTSLPISTNPKKIVPTTEQQQTRNTTPKPTAYPTTNPALITANLSFEKQGSWVNVVLETGVTPVSGIQLVISYNPDVLTNVTVAPGSFFTNPNILQNQVDTAKGTITYVLAVPPGEQQKTGKGTVATISYQLAPDAKTVMNFLQDTKITSEGVNDSVLKTKEGIALP